MTNIINFQSYPEREAKAQLIAFIEWAKRTLDQSVRYGLVHSGIHWDLHTWSVYGVEGSAFTSWGVGNVRSSSKKYMNSEFGDFARSFTIYRAIFLRKKSLTRFMAALRALEVSLFEITGAYDITKLSSAICYRAFEILKNKYPKKSTLFCYSNGLEVIIAFLNEKKLLVNSFSWVSPLPYTRKFSLDELRENSLKKLPTREAIQALGELFNNELSNPLDVVVVSACALLLSQPSRVGELADVECDCVIYKKDISGNKRMFLKWFSEKGYGETLKPVVSGMEPVVTRALELLKPITEEARNFAAWLEDNPDNFPPHDEVPNKGLDEPLTYEEVAKTLKIKKHKDHSCRGDFRDLWLKLLRKKDNLSKEARDTIDEILQGWDHSRGKRIHTEINGKSHVHYEYNDKTPVTLRKLNILVREKYLPKDFPYTTEPTDGKKRIKYRDALFTVRTGSLSDASIINISLPLNLGVENAAKPMRIAAQLGSSKKVRSIFARHGYGSIKVKSHSFRHELNTEMHRAGLSQLLIDAFSGRTSRGSVYNHVSIEERTQAVALVHPKTKPSNQVLDLEKIRTNQPLKLSDITELKAGSPDLVIHQTHLGLCTHRFEQEPCPKMGACLSCGNLVCVKGDDVKLANLKEEKDYLEQRYQKAKEAEANGDFGAAEWRKKLEQDLFKCSELIRLLEDPDLEDGSLVWNADNGWNLTNNAAVMSGLIDSITIEAQIEQQKALPSLNSLAESLKLIED